MYNTVPAPTLEPLAGGKIALCAVNIEAEVENLLCKVTIKQVYRNLEKVNIEAVYTFPLPLEAVLLDLAITTATKKLTGVVVEHAEAERRYEDAIIDGDTAVMLEQVDPGLFTMNVGNLQPEDTIEIEITYAELFKWRDNTLRFFLPTTIAPRYGDPECVSVQPHQEPEYDLVAENRFSISLAIHGVLAAASIKSPSHKIVSERKDGKTILSLEEGRALMDRDFVLNFVMENGAASAIHIEPDGDNHIVLASFFPEIPASSHMLPRCITIIVDCSGSMGGDSICQAQKALCEILGLLRPADMFNVICFGSSYVMLFPKPVRAEGDNLQKARDMLESLDADMGGTEIGQAVAAVLKAKTAGDQPQDVLLITDGEVWEWEKVTAMAAQSGFRFFTVGVGSSVSEAFVRQLADATGGACELVVPREDMAEKIVRHFKRIYFPRAVNAEVVWPAKPLQTVPEIIGSVYDGDTLHVFGRFEKRPEGYVELRAVLENGRAITQKLFLEPGRRGGQQAYPPSTMARMAAACQIRQMQDPDNIAALAVKHQLMSRFTKYLVVDVKNDGDKAADLPVLRKVPQVPAAGWGGLGTVADVAARSNQASFSVRRSDSGVRFKRRDMRPFEGIGFDLGYFIQHLSRVRLGLFAVQAKVSAISDLEAKGAPAELVEALEELVKTGFDEQVVVTVFLYLLLQQEKCGPKFSRAAKRVIKKAYKRLPEVPDQVLLQQLEEEIESYLQIHRVLFKL